MHPWSRGIHGRPGRHRRRVNGPVLRIGPAEISLYEPILPAVSSLGGFRTPAPRRRPMLCWGRRPKPFTTAAKLARRLNVRFRGAATIGRTARLGAVRPSAPRTRNVRPPPHYRRAGPENKREIFTVSAADSLANRSKRRSYSGNAINGVNACLVPRAGTLAKSCFVPDERREAEIASISSIARLGAGPSGQFFL